MSLPEFDNIYIGIPQRLPEEMVDNLLETESLRIERIVSKGHASPPGFWYDQPEDEWVIVLKGATRIEYEKGETVALGPGDFLTIPAHVRHRVEWTDPNEETVWLAIHYPARPCGKDPTQWGVRVS